MTHTPTPWYLDQDNAEGIVIKGSDGQEIFQEWQGDLPSEWTSSLRTQVWNEIRSNFHMVLQRVNAHDELVAALKGVVRESECYCADYVPPGIGNCYWCVASSVLAKAEAK